MDEMQRRIPLSNGKRVAIKQTQSTWLAIDYVSDRRGQTWREWCANVIEAASEAEKNLTAVIRETAMNQLLADNVLNVERASSLETMSLNNFTKNSGVINDEELAPYLASASGQADFVGFSVIFGVDSDGNDYLAVRNGLRGGVHFVTISESYIK